MSSLPLFTAPIICPFCFSFLCTSYRHWLNWSVISLKTLLKFLSHSPKGLTQASWCGEAHSPFSCLVVVWFPGANSTSLLVLKDFFWQIISHLKYLSRKPLTEKFFCCSKNIKMFRKQSTASVVFSYLLWHLLNPLPLKLLWQLLFSLWIGPVLIYPRHSHGIINWATSNMNHSEKPTDQTVRLFLFSNVRNCSTATVQLTALEEQKISWPKKLWLH